MARSADDRPALRRPVRAGRRRGDRRRLAGLAGRAGVARAALGAARGAQLGAYGVVATLQPSADFGRVLAAYGGIFVVGSLLWAMALDGYRPDRYDLGGAAVCLLGVAVIAYAPRGA